MTDVTKTRTDFKTEALRLITGLDSSQTLDAEDLETMDGFVDPLLAQLAVKKVVYITDSEAIPVAYFLPLVRLLANAAGPGFGQPVSAAVNVAEEAELRTLTAAQPTYETMQAEYI